MCSLLSQPPCFRISSPSPSALVGVFWLSPIPLMPRGVPEIEVTFEIDASGTLDVRVTEISGGCTNKVTITNFKGRKEDIERMVSEGGALVPRP